MTRPVEHRRSTGDRDIEALHRILKRVRSSTARTAEEQEQVEHHLEQALSILVRTPEGKQHLKSKVRSPKSEVRNGRQA